MPTERTWWTTTFSDTRPCELRAAFRALTNGLKLSPTNADAPRVSRATSGRYHANLAALTEPSNHRAYYAVGESGHYYTKMFSQPYHSYSSFASSFGIGLRMVASLWYWLHEPPFSDAAEILRTAQRGLQPST